MSEDDEPADYYAYLLRLWRADDTPDSTADDGGCRLWHVSLESARTGERQGFGSLEALFDHLRERTGASPDAQNPKEGRDEE
jgi:hypothetical protein